MKAIQVLLNQDGLPCLLFMHYLAIPFRSYYQPLLVMSVIPFGLIGAVLGHLLFSIPLSQLSMFGIVALTGVVINDSLVLVHYVNQNSKIRVSFRGCPRKREWQGSDQSC